MTGFTTQKSGWSEPQKGGLWREVWAWESSSEPKSPLLFGLSSVYQHWRKKQQDSVLWEGFVRPGAGAAVG